MTRLIVLIVAFIGVGCTHTANKCFDAKGTRILMEGSITGGKVDIQIDENGYYRSWPLEKCPEGTDAREFDQTAE